MSNNIKQVVITIIVIVIIVIMLILGIRAITSLFKNTFRGTGTKTTTTSGVQTKPTLDEGLENIGVVKEPVERYEGTLQFTATVDRVVGVRAFVVKNTEVFGNEILVISEDGIAPIGAKSPDEFLLQPGDRLFIKGRLEKFITENLKDSSLRKASMINLTTWSGKPVIIASDIDRIQ